MAAVLTTSLYGKSSQYNRLKEWAYIGQTEGVAITHIPQSVRRGCITHAKRAALRGTKDRASGATIGNFFSLFGEVCSNLGITAPKATAKRGVYVAPLAANAQTWLRDGHGELNHNAKTAVEASEFWQNRWRDMRFPKKADEVSEWDPAYYSLNATMERMEDERAPSKGTSGSQPEAGGVNPTRALQNSGPVE